MVRKRRSLIRASLIQVVFNSIIFLTVAIGALVVFMPFLWAAFTSLKEASEIQRVPLTFFPDNIFNFKNYLEVFRRMPFLRYFSNSTLVSVACVSVSLFFSSLSGYGFAKFNFPGKEILFFGILAVLMVPFQVIVIPLYFWVIKLRLVDSYPGIALPGLISAFGVFLMREAIGAVPDDYIDSARIDGCSEFRIYWNIILPNVKPALAALGIIKFLWTWNEFLWPLIVTNSELKKVVTIGLADFANMYYVEYHLATAGSLLSMLPILLVFIFLQKWVVKAMVLSGMKG